MKLTLIHPPQPKSLDDRLDIPLQLAYLANFARKNIKDLKVKIVDLSSVEESAWKEKIGYADLYGVTVYTASYNKALKIRDICNQHNSRGCVIAGGHHVTALPEQSLKDFPVVVGGEGEQALVNVIKANFPGYYSCGRGDIDDYDYPAWDLLDFASYHRKIGGKRCISVITSRGCPYSCNFCSRDVMGSRVRFRSKEKVLEEIRYLVDNYTNSFIFYDDVFVMNRSRLYWLCDRFKELGIKFRCNGRVGINTYEDFKKLKEGGCDEIDFGIESGSQKMLDLMGKKVTTEQNKTAIREAQQAGLIVKAFLVLGFPGETKETVEETKRFIMDSAPDVYSLFGFIPFPGSDTFRNPSRYGIQWLSSNWDEYYCMAGQNESGLSFYCESYTIQDFLDWKRGMTDLLVRVGYQGETQDYERKVKWR